MSELKAFTFCLGQYTENGSPCVVAFDGERNPRLASDGKFYLKSEADKVIEEQKRQIEFLKTTHDSCGNCNRCANGMGKVFDENLDELKAKIAQLEDDVAFWKAKAKEADK